MTFRLAAFAGLALGFLLVLPAQAATIKAVYTGSIQAGVDETNYFGLGSDLASATYAATYLYDTGQGLRTTTATMDDVLGGTLFSAPTPILDAFITINGVTRHFSAADAGEAVMNSQFNFIGHTARIYLAPLIDVYLVAAVDIPIGQPADLEAAFTQSNGCLDCGRFRFFDGASSITARLDIRQLQVTAVPEPMSWALLIAGFGLAGAVLRRRAAVA